MTGNIPVYLRESHWLSKLETLSASQVSYLAKTRTRYSNDILKIIIIIIANIACSKEDEPKIQLTELVLAIIV